MAVTLPPPHCYGRRMKEEELRPEFGNPISGITWSSDLGCLDAEEFLPAGSTYQLCESGNWNWPASTTYSR